MKNYKLIIITIISFLSGCEKIRLPKGTPSCIKNEIKKLKSNRNTEISIWKYNYHGQSVYYVQSGCCDIENILLDENCNRICSPDGGISGNGDGKCEDFNTDKSDEELIWKE